MSTSVTVTHARGWILLVTSTSSTFSTHANDGMNEEFCGTSSICPSQPAMKPPCCILLLAMLSGTAALKRSALKHSLTRATTTIQCERALRNLAPLQTPKEYGLAFAALDRCELPWQRSHELLNTMAEPDNLAISACLRNLARQGEWRTALQIFEQAAPTADVFAFNSLLSALVTAGELATATSLLRAHSSAPEGNVKPDEVSYRTVLTGLANAKDWDAAIELLSELREWTDANNWRVERGTYGICARASADLGPVEREVALLDALRRRGVPLDEESYLLAAYACKAEANATAAMDLLAAHESEPGLPPGEAFYAAIIATCGRARAWDAQWDAYKRAQTAAWERDDINMGAVSITNILHSCAQSGRFRKAKTIIEQLLASDESESRLRWKLPETRDVMLYGAAIACCDAGGQWQRALQLLDAMERREGLTPDLACYTSAMTAVASAGNVPEGMRLLRRMRARAPAHMVAASYGVHRIMLEACRRAEDSRRCAEVEAMITESGLTPLAAVADLAPRRRTSRQRQTFVNAGVDAGGKPSVQERVRKLCKQLRDQMSYTPRYEALPPAFLRKSSRRQRDRSLQSHAEKRALAHLIERNCERLEISINFHVWYYEPGPEQRRLHLVPFLSDSQCHSQ
jgi:pentatricopeptide repeat protein